jgi:hypothetical protein
MKNNLKAIDHFLNSMKDDQHPIFHQVPVIPPKPKPVPVTNTTQNNQRKKNQNRPNTWVKKDFKQLPTKQYKPVKSPSKRLFDKAQHIKQRHTPKSNSKRLFINERLDNFTSKSRVRDKFEDIRRIREDFAQKGEVTPEYENFQIIKDMSKKKKKNSVMRKRDKEMIRPVSKVASSSSFPLNIKLTPFNEFLQQKGYKLFEDNQEPANYVVADADYWTQTSFEWDVQLKKKNWEVFGHKGFRMNQVII